MATKLYKQTFRGQPTASEVHDEVGLGGGVIVRIDQTNDETTVYFEALDNGKTPKPGGNISEVSIKDVTKI